MEKVLLGTIDASKEWQESKRHDALKCMKDEFLWTFRATQANYSEEYIKEIKELAHKLREHQHD